MGDMLERSLLAWMVTWRSALWAVEGDRLDKNNAALNHSWKINISRFMAEGGAARPPPLFRFMLRLGWAIQLPRSSC